MAPDIRVLPLWMVYVYTLYLSYTVGLPTVCVCLIPQQRPLTITMLTGFLAWLAPRRVILSRTRRLASRLQTPEWPVPLGASTGAIMSL